MPPARLRGLTVGAATATAAYRLAAPRSPAAWTRRNYRDRPVTLAAGPALAAGAVAGALAAGPGQPAAAALATAVVLAAVAGGYDDARGTPAQRGLHGHLLALRRGTVTTGAVKVAAIGGGALLGAWQLTGGPGSGTSYDASVARAGRRSDRRWDVLVAGGLIAGAANLLNLLDLRPGRAAKAGLAVGGALLTRPAGWPAAGAVGAAAALLPADLRERAMLGDCGANALGAAVGVGLAAATPSRRGRAALLAGLTGVTLASERVSFSAVIDASPPLRWLDRLGRLP